MPQTINNLDFTVDCDHVYLWQYNDAQKLSSILKGTENFIKIAVGDFWNSYLEDIFTIATASSFGLEVWGRTLGIPRPTYTESSTGNIVSIGDELYRRMLIGAIYKFNMSATVPEVNQYLRYIFGNKAIYVVDGLDMTMKVIVYFDITEEEFSVLSSDDFIPRPAGVGVNIEIYSNNKIFGFSGSELEGFDVGTFAK
jgi:hypothetical protein